MEEWKVLFAGSSAEEETDFELFFRDVKELIGEYLGLKEEAIEGLRKLLEEKENYNLVVNIKRITPPESGEKFFDIDVAWVILCLDQQDLPYGYLFLGGVLVGIWPKEYAEEIGKNAELLTSMLSSVILKPDIWKRVDIIFPIEESG
ncbi:MAG: hypothetical protein ACTSVA_02675 [Candidatus Njordarchaeales archaeon]